MDLTYWIMAGITGVVKFIEAYRRPGTAGDKLLAAADGLTAIVVWRALSTSAIALWAAARTSSYGRGWPEIPEEAFSALAVLVALAGTRAVMAFLMRIKFVRGVIDEPPA
jgi:hypothetical protein